MKQMHIQQMWNQQHDEITRLKSDYNALLKRYHKANEFFHTAEPHQIEKFESAYKDIIVKMQDICNELKMKYRIEASYHEILGGFKL